jgi:hypothetical protein
MRRGFESRPVRTFSIKDIPQSTGFGHKLCKFPAGRPRQCQENVHGMPVGVALSSADLGDRLHRLCERDCSGGCECPGHRWASPGVSPTAWARSTSPDQAPRAAATRQRPRCVSTSMHDSCPRRARRIHPGGRSCETDAIPHRFQRHAMMRNVYSSIKQYPNCEDRTGWQLIDV